MSDASNEDAIKERALSAEGASLVAAREEELAVQGAATDSQKAYAVERSLAALREQFQGQEHEAASNALEGAKQELLAADAAKEALAKPPGAQRVALGSQRYRRRTTARWLWR